ncbi:MAG: Rrf2 family transcriptional regulator [Rhodospirillaceae bacterium]|jgi:Rrf2 family transcriptional regulator, iron-sulfur cluster assembly transcription factor|nr:Rrf2 family transcriptional regulator [Rhodospirillaceae bacterium]
MKLSTKGRYAVMAIVDLAREKSDRPTPLAEIAKRQKISLSYLEQLFAKLRRSQLVLSVRGPGGGYMIARPAGDIRVSEVILAVDPPPHNTACNPADPKGCCNLPETCGTHDLWAALADQMYGFLDSISIADVRDRRVRSAMTDEEIIQSDRAAAS